MIEVTDIDNFDEIKSMIDQDDRVDFDFNIFSSIIHNKNQKNRKRK